MINTIEVAPAILAASLAEHLCDMQHNYIFIDMDGDRTFDTGVLREIIRDFLTKDTLK